MIDHISLPVSDYARSRAFYDKALGALGYKVAMEITDAPDFVAAGYGACRLPEPAFWIGAGRAPGPAPVPPEGQHIAFRAADRAAVDAFYAARWPRAARTTAPPACGRTITPATMPPSSSTRTGIGSRRCATGRSEQG